MDNNKSKKKNKKQLSDIEAIKTVVGDYRPKIKNMIKQNIESVFIKQNHKKK
jgi:hypothetical protein